MDNFEGYGFGDRPVTGVNLLLLLGEMEGVYQHLKYMGFEEDMNTVDKMKKDIIVFTSRPNAILCGSAVELDDC